MMFLAKNTKLFTNAVDNIDDVCAFNSFVIKCRRVCTS